MKKQSKPKKKNHAMVTDSLKTLKPAYEALLKDYEKLYLENIELKEKYNKLKLKADVWEAESEYMKSIIPYLLRISKGKNKKNPEEEFLIPAINSRYERMNKRGYKLWNAMQETLQDFKIMKTFKQMEKLESAVTSYRNRMKKLGELQPFEPIKETEINGVKAYKKSPIE